MDKHTKKYLEPLFDLTPLSEERLKLAWPNLSNQEKAYVMNKSRTAVVQQLALNDDNPYIKYLAAREISEEQSLFKQVQEDKTPLVRNAHNENQMGPPSSLSPEEFWQLPRIERLTYCNLSGSSGLDRILDALEFAYKPEHQANVSLINVEEVVRQTFGINNNKALENLLIPRKNQLFSSPIGEDEIRRAWNLVSKTPSRSFTRYTLLNRLPFFDELISSSTQDFTVDFEDWDLEKLLQRSDVTAGEFRYRVYKERFCKAEERGGLYSKCRVSHAAVTSNVFRIKDCDLLELVIEHSDTEESISLKSTELKLLFEYTAEHLTFAQAEMVFDLREKFLNKDYLVSMPWNNSWYRPFDFYDDQERHYLEQKDSEGFYQELYEAKLYLRCKEICEEELSFPEYSGWNEVKDLFDNKNPIDAFIQIKAKSSVPQQWANWLGGLSYRWPYCFTAFVDTEELEDLPELQPAPSEKVEPTERKSWLSRLWDV